MNQEKRQELRQVWAAHQAMLAEEGEEMNALAPEHAKIINHARSLVRQAMENNDNEEPMSKYEEELAMYKSFNEKYRERELRKERGEEEPLVKPQSAFNSTISAERIYAARKEARVARLRAQALPSQAPLYQDQDQDDDEESEQLKEKVALLDATSIYDARADARKQRSKR